MNKLILCLKAFAYALLCAFLLSLTMTVLQVRESIASNSIAQSAQDLITAAHKTVDGVNGTLLTKDAKDNQQRTAVQEILDNLAGTSRLAYQATKAQQDYWKSFPLQAQGTLNRVNTLVDHFQGRADSLMDNLIALTGNDGAVNGVLTALKRDLETLDGTLAQTKQAIADLDKNLLQDEDIKTTLAELAKVMTHTDGITAHFEQMSADFANKIHHSLTDPPTLKSKIIVGLRIAYQLALLRAALGQ